PSRAPRPAQLGAPDRHDRDAADRRDVHPRPDHQARYAGDDVYRVSVVPHRPAELSTGSRHARERVVPAWLAQVRARVATAPDPAKPARAPGTANASCIRTVRARTAQLGKTPVLSSPDEHRIARTHGWHARHDRDVPALARA